MSLREIVVWGRDFETFHYFLKFPQEVQDIIWSYSCKIRRRVEVIDNTAKKGLAFVPKAPYVPSVLHICRASRQIGLGKYLVLPMSTDPPTSTKIYFNPEVDIICFGYRCFNGLKTVEWLEKNTYVQYIECKIELWRLYSHEWARRLFDAFRQFDSLREVTFLHQAVNPEVLLGPIIKGGFEDIVEVQKGWRAPEVNYVNCTKFLVDASRQ